MAREIETGVRIEATIKLDFTAYGVIEEKLRKGEDVTEEAERLVEDVIECCGLAGQDMKVKDIEYSLNE